MEQEPEKRRRRPRKMKKRRLWIPLLIAILCVAGVLLIAIGGSGDDTPTIPTENEKTVIHLAAGGDLNITDDVVAAAGHDGNFRDAFIDVLPLLSNADLTILNLEGTFCGEPYGSESKSAPANLCNALAAAGVDAVQLANSCAIRGGISGLVSTIDTAKNAGLIPLGAYRSKAEAAAERGFSVVEVKGVRIALVAFTKGMDGMTLPAGSEGCVNVLYKDYDSTYQKVDTEGITKVMKSVAEAKPDIIVTMLHWGSEFNDTISASQKQICKLLQENGADVIIGSHPHYVQKMEFDPASGMFVAYSLGDFFGDAVRPGSEYSVLLDLEITKDNVTGETKVTNYSYTPIFTVREEFKLLRVVRIRETMGAYENHYIDSVSKATYDAMKYALQRIEARVQGE